MSRRGYLGPLRLYFVVVSIVAHAWASPKLEDDLSRVFVGRSFTIRNFYRGTHLRYGSNGQMLDRAEPGYWSRDGMVEFTSIKISGNTLIMLGNRTCVLLDQHEGVFSNVKTGDHVQIDVQLTPDLLTTQAVLTLLQSVLLSSNDRLADLVPSYWANCLSRKVKRRDEHSPWQCVVDDQQSISDLAGERVTWDIPPQDTSLHTGTRHYLIRHRVAYLAEPGVKSPMLNIAPDPMFDWEQNRTHIKTSELVLSCTVGEDGRVRDMVIVSPVGMGIDDDAVKTMKDWQFTPAMLGDKRHAVHARVFFDIVATY